jgi:hypothetical protein
MESSSETMPVEQHGCTRSTTNAERSVAAAVDVESLCRRGRRHNSIECLAPQQRTLLQLL